MDMRRTLYKVPFLHVMKKVKIPEKLTEDLVELVGIHFGDGSLHRDKKCTYRISYSLDGAYGEYVLFVSRLFEKSFGILLHFSKDKRNGGVSLRTCSKRLFFYFQDVLLIPPGKKEQLRIPSYVYSNKKFAYAFFAWTC